MASIIPCRANTGSTGTTSSNRRPSLASYPSSRRTTSNQSAPRDAAQHATSSQQGSNQSAGLTPNSLHASLQSTISRKGRKVKPQYPADSEEKHVEYILVASFDIDRGSIMENQYPGPIGGDENMLAELMLPDQTHLRSQDWTIFFLHKDTSGEDYASQPNMRRKGKRKQEVGEQAVEGASGETERAGTDIEGEESSSEEDEPQDDGLEKPPLVYVLNLVNTKKDEKVARGAIVKAMAICTRHSFLHIYKPLLLLALEAYFKAPIPETLASLYDAVNNMDLSVLPRLSFYEQYILGASDVKDLFIEKFEIMIQQRMAASKDKQPVATPGLSGRPRYGLPRDTHEYESVVLYNNVPVPVKIPTAVSPETVGDFSLIKLIQTFSNPHASSPQPFAHQHSHLTTSGPLTHPIIVLLNALLTQKRVIFIGHNLPSSEVAEAVLAACALASGGLLHGFTRHAFPYTDLTKIDDLLKVPGFIAGVTNPAFALRSEWWDLLCDLPTGRMKISPKLEPVQPTEGVLFFQQTGPHSAAALLQAEQQRGAAAPTSSMSMSLIASAFPTTNSHPSAVGDPTGDAALMHSILTSIAERRGEGAIRAKFCLWILKFTRLAAAFEEMVYGASALHQAPLISPTTTRSHASSPLTPHSDVSTSLPQHMTPTSNPDPSVAGHGYVWPTIEMKLRELAANATRIEGWMKTRSHYNFIQDLARSSAFRPVKSLDLQHLHDRLARLRPGPDASAAIYLAIASTVKTYSQINQLLSVVINASAAPGTSAALGSTGGGGLFYLALGLFHPRGKVREAVAELLGRIKEHEAGRHFWERLGRFERGAWERVVLARREREEDEGLGAGMGAFGEA